jgi:hypothetical protein
VCHFSGLSILFPCTIADRKARLSVVQGKKIIKRIGMYSS